MQFTKDTIEIPDELIKAHENGDVVFFCGAGISYDAGLPLFKGLLEETAKGVNHAFSPAEQILLRDGKYDQLYQLIERAIGNKELVRRESASHLHPTRDDDNAISLHKALLTLSKSNNDHYRIVTTNYDCLFDWAMERLGLTINVFKAPLLPIPKKYKFDGIVHLHGKLDDKLTAENLNSLVISSGDFGLAYLNERWASRFVSELFREHTVCFVGYSVNDVIVKYMIDALASEAMQGANARPVYAFSGVPKAKIDSDRKSWESKGIVPLQYITTEAKGYKVLRDTLVAWSHQYETGRLAKASLLRELVAQHPDSLTKDGKKKISRFKWTVTDVIAANVLQEFDVGVSRSWLEYVSPDLIKDDKIGRSILAWVGKLMPCVESLQWCLNNERFLTDAHLQILSYYLGQAKFSDRYLSCLWHLYLAGFHQRDRILTDAWLRDVISLRRLDSGHRAVFAKMVFPSISLSQKMPSFVRAENDAREVFNWDIVVGDCAYLFEGRDEEKRFLAELLPEISTALMTVGAIQSDLSDGQEHEDLSFFEVPSLADRKNSYRSSHWSTLLLLLCDGFDGLVAFDKRKARHFVKSWGDARYPVFYRVFLFTATTCPDISSGYILRWLRRNMDALRFENCERELFDFLDKRGPSFSDSQLNFFEELLFGCDQIRDSKRATCIEHLHLNNAPISQYALKFLEDFSVNHPSWASRSRQADGLRVIEDLEECVDAAKNCHNLNEQMPMGPQAAKDYFLQLNGQCDWERRKQWSEYCREKPLDAFSCLMIVGKEYAYWPAQVWTNAFKSFRLLQDAKAVADVMTAEQADAFPIELLDFTQLELAYWMQTAAKDGASTAGFMRLCQRFIFEVPAHEPVSGTDNSNAPYEMAMESILRVWFARSETQKGAGVPADVRQVVDYAVRGETRSAQYARRPLLQQFSELYIIDSEWTRRNVYPLLSWKRQGDAAIEAWNCTVLSSRYVEDLMRDVGDDFLEAGHHYEALDGFSRQWYCGHFLKRCMPVASWDNRGVLTGMIRDLPSGGRSELARQIYTMIENAKGHSDEVWSLEVYPFLRKVWPGEKECIDDVVATHFISTLVFLDQKFEEGVAFVGSRVRLKIPADCHLQILTKGEKDKQPHCVMHPSASLRYLDFFSSFGGVGISTMKTCLVKIVSSDPKLAKSPIYRKLQEKAAESSY